MTRTTDDRPVVTFVTRTLEARWPDIDSVGSPVSMPDRFRSGIDTWIVQTYLELRALQEDLPFRVAIASSFPKNMPAIAHRDDLRAGALYYRSYLAETRADRDLVHSAAWHVVQGPAQVAERAVLIPFWPQPGLIPRSPEREGMSTLSFFGRSGSMPGFFTDPAFVDALAARSVRFRFSEKNWHDYSGTDVCVAIRYDPEIGSHFKPFSKLINAWAAGTPALLGPEPAFRWLRRNALDYIEVTSGRDILGAVDRLQREPGLFEAMIENGRMRAKEFTREQIRQMWIEFIEQQFLPAWRQWQTEKPGDVARFFKFVDDLATQRRERIVYKGIESMQRQAIAESGIGERLE